MYVFSSPSFLLFETAPEYVQERGDVTYTLVEPWQSTFGGTPGTPAIPVSSEHTREEQGESRTFSVTAAFASGSNVKSEIISGSIVLPPGFKIPTEKP